MIKMFEEFLTESGNVRTGEAISVMNKLWEELELHKQFGCKPLGWQADWNNPNKTIWMELNGPVYEKGMKETSKEIRDFFKPFNIRITLTLTRSYYKISTKVDYVLAAKNELTALDSYLYKRWKASGIESLQDFLKSAEWIQKRAQTKRFGL